MPPAQYPETPITLMGRLVHSENEIHWNDAWTTFYELYRPAIRVSVIRAFMRCGWKSVPDYIVDETLSDVLVSLQQGCKKFLYDPALGRFRGYVAQLVHWKVQDRLKAIRKNPHENEDTLKNKAGDDPSAYEAITQSEDQAWEYSTLAMMLEEVAMLVSPQTFLIFEQTKIKERSPDLVIAELGISRSTLDNANHRVMKKLISLARTDEYRKELLP